MMTDEKRAQQLRFLAEVDATFDRVRQIITQRGKEYNHTRTIQDNLPTPQRAFDLVELKLFRAKDQLARWTEEATDSTRSSLEDSLLDLMAYTSFTLAWLQEPKDAGE